MKKKDFLLEVMNELNTIKSRASSAEIDKLNLESFDHANGYHCIYGQMTGKCDNIRACQIMKKTYDEMMITFTTYVNDDHIPWKSQDTSCGTEYTALEKYLFIVSTKSGNTSKKHKEIINYLKGNITSIEL